LRVSAKYSIPTPVPFVDVHVEKDNRLFIDPSAIRNGTDARSRRAHNLIVDFFTEVLRLRASTSTADHVTGQSLLYKLHEPNQTRLGMSAKGVGGRAFGPGLADELWDILGSNPAAQSAVITRLEHLPLFIEGVGPDLISDLSTRIIFDELADFTHDMMVAHPRLAGATSVDTIDIYDPTAKTWAAKNYTLPFVAPHQLLLVPKEWVFWRLLMEPTPFYNRFSTETVRIERGQWGDDDKFHGPSKEALNREFPARRQLNIDQSVKYKEEQDRDLVREYERYVDENFDPLSDDEIEARTN
jgi:hypothetical protein